MTIGRLIEYLQKRVANEKGVELSREEIENVFDRIGDYDASIEINWDTIGFVIDAIFDDRKNVS